MATSIPTVWLDGLYPETNSWDRHSAAVVRAAGKNPDDCEVDCVKLAVSEVLESLREEAHGLTPEFWGRLENLNPVKESLYAVCEGTRAILAIVSPAGVSLL